MKTGIRTFGTNKGPTSACTGSARKDAHLSGMDPAGAEGKIMKYSEKYILFIDVLGFQAYINSTVNNGLDNEFEIQRFYNFFQILRENLCMDFEKDHLQEIRKKRFFSDASITQFSDSLIITKEANSIESLETLILDANHIQLTGSYYGFVLRGGIKKGKVIHERDLVFGPDFVNAYNMESELAIFPRIVLDSELVTSDALQRKIIQDLVKMDYDGVHYIDIFRGMDYRFGNHGPSKKITVESIERIIAKGLKEKSVVVQHKYLWLQEKLRAFRSGT